MSAQCPDLPKAADQASLFDHLVDGGEQLRMEFEAEHLGGLKVDYEFEFGGLLVIHEAKAGPPLR